MKQLVDDFSRGAPATRARPDRPAPDTAREVQRESRPGRTVDASVVQRLQRGAGNKAVSAMLAARKPRTSSVGARPGAGAAAGTGVAQRAETGAATKPGTQDAPHAGSSAPVVAQRLATPPAAPATSGKRPGPAADPKFAALTTDVRGKQKVLSAHLPPQTEAAAAAAAAKAPPDDAQAQGKAANAEKMNAAKPGEFDKAAFIRAVNDAIAAQAPKNLDEADNFAGSGKADAVKGRVSGQVTDGKAKSAGPIATTTAAPPDTSKATVKPVTPLAPDRPPPTPGAPNPAQAVPDVAPPSATDLSAGPREVDQEMAAAQITETQLAGANEPEFTGALTAKKAGEAHAATAPAKMRGAEAQTLAGAKAQAQQASAAAMTGMASTRNVVGAAVQSGKTAAKGSDESKRAQVTGILQKVFDATKREVEAILTGLDGKVDAKFTAEEGAARAAFTAEHKRRMNEYKDKRYGGLLGKGRWVKDKFAGLPEEANQIFVAARQLYVDRMQGVISSVADLISAELGRAKARIAAGRDQLQAEVTKLPADLQAIGKESAAGFSGQFDELTESVDAKGSELVQTLASKYTEALGKVDEEIAAEKEKNQGLIDKAKNAVVGVVKTILELKDLLLGVLARAAQAVMAIIKDPIGFLGKLVSAVGAGLQGFLANIGTHLQKGLLSWLLGTAAKAGLQLPQKFDLRGILGMIASLLGLTWGAIRGRVVARGVPDEAMTVVEGSVPLAQKLQSEGVAGVADDIADQVGDLKENLFTKISQYIIPTVITAGITWVISLLNPASAFIKACKMIVDFITFIVTRGAQIAQFMNAILDAVIAIAAGGAGGVPALVENALAKSIPVLIGVFAAILGVGGIAEKVKGFFMALAKPVGKAIDWVVDKIVGFGKAIWARLKASVATRRVGDRRGIGEANGAGQGALAERQRRAIHEADRLLSGNPTQGVVTGGIAAISRSHNVPLRVVHESRVPDGEIVHVQTMSTGPHKINGSTYDPTKRTVSELWLDCDPAHKFSSAETPGETASRLTGAQSQLQMKIPGLQLPILQAVLGHDSGRTMRPFASIDAEEGYGGHTVLKHVRGRQAMGDGARSLAIRLLTGSPSPMPPGAAGYFVSTSEANIAVGMVLDAEIRPAWTPQIRDRLIHGKGREVKASPGPVGYALRLSPGFGPGTLPTYLGGTYPGPLFLRDSRAANPSLPPMTERLICDNVLVTINPSAAAPGGWFVVRSYPVV